MPNWVRNTLIFKNPKDLFEKVNNGNFPFDFNKIIPMPKDLDLTSPTGWYEGNQFHRPKEFETNIIKPMLDCLYNKEITQQEFVCLAQKELEIRCLVEDFKKAISARPEDVFKGYFNYHRYCYLDWYDWRIDIWGTKWNSSEVHFNGNTVIFDTAWSMPLGIIRKLASEYDFVIMYADEDIGSNFGVLIADDGLLKKADLNLTHKEGVLFSAMVHYCDTELDGIFIDTFKYTDEEYNKALETYDKYNNFYKGDK